MHVNNVCVNIYVTQEVYNTNLARLYFPIGFYDQNYITFLIFVHRHFVLHCNVLLVHDLTFSLPHFWRNQSESRSMKQKSHQLALIQKFSPQGLWSEAYHCTFQSLKFIYDKVIDAAFFVFGFLALKMRAEFVWK